MQTIKTWMQAARLRTLPLSVAGILAGTAVALEMGYRDTLLFLLTLATTLAYQITSNFANDYGDGVKGTDNENRIGPRRALQSGAISRASLKRAIIASALCSALLTLVTLLYAFGREYLQYLLVFLLLGALAIWAAIRYTVGEGAYGYRGLGDIFVFVFFGLLSVQGSQFLYTREVPATAWLPAYAIGALSVAVLNLNNLRDLEPDRLAGKRTLAVLMGYAAGRRYHYTLCLSSLAAMVLYTMLHENWQSIAICLSPYVLIGIHLGRVARVSDPAALDPELKKVAISTFLIGLLLWFVNNYFL